MTNRVTILKQDETKLKHQNKKLVRAEQKIHEL